nr:hypothetical protein [Crucivirus sp.]
MCVPSLSLLATLSDPATLGSGLSTTGTLVGVLKEISSMLASLISFLRTKYNLPSLLTNRGDASFSLPLLSLYFSNFLLTFLIKFVCLAVGLKTRRGVEPPPNCS